MTRSTLPLLLVCACADPLLPGEHERPPAPLQPGVPEAAACALDEAATTLIVTTTDLATGAVTVVDAAGQVHADVAVGSSDAIPYSGPDGPVIVHRHQFDYVDVLAAGTWRSRGQFALSTDDAASPNPQAIAFDEDGLGYVTLFASRLLLVLDPTAPPTDAVVDAIDLSPFADDDGVPEAGVAVRCGDTLWVGVQQIEVPGYASLGPDTLVAVDLHTRLPWDFDPDAPGGQGLPLLGTWLKQVHRDPADPTALYGLTAGLEHIDLERLESSWVVPPEAFAAVGAGSYMQPMAFALGPEGRWAWVAAYVSEDGFDFHHGQLFEVDLTADAPSLQPFGAPFQALDRPLARIGDTLWVGSRETEAPGLSSYDLTTHPPTRTAGPLSTGLPPYSLTAVP